MSFLALSNADFQFGVEELTWRSYTAAEALPTTNWVELIDKREFAKAALDGNSKTFVVHVATLEISTTMPIHPSRASQLWDDPAQVAALQWDKIPTEIPAEYSDYSNVFSSDLAIELPENTGMNKHAIKLIEGKQLPYCNDLVTWPGHLTWSPDTAHNLILAISRSHGFSSPQNATTLRPTTYAQYLTYAWY